MFALCWATTFTFSLIFLPTFLPRFISRLDKYNTDFCFSPFDSSLHNMSLQLPGFPFSLSPAAGAFGTCVCLSNLEFNYLANMRCRYCHSGGHFPSPFHIHSLSIVVAPVAACNLDSLIILTGGHVDNRTKSTVWVHWNRGHPYTKIKILFNMK